MKSFMSLGIDFIQQSYSLRRLSKSLVRPPGTSRPILKAALIVVVIVIVAVAVFLSYQNLRDHKAELRVYFQDANGLRAGAPVRLAGVEVGRIASVRARPEMQGPPAEVMMKLRTPYEFHVPNDATVSLYTEGVLGETFAEINVLGRLALRFKVAVFLKKSQQNSSHSKS